MDRHLVLLKYFEVNEKLKTNKNDFKKEIKNSKYNFNPEKIPRSARNILTTLINNDNINQRTLAKNINISSQAVSETLKKLEENQFITRTAGQLNNENIISLTEKGREAGSLFDTRIKEHANKFFNKLDDKELETLYSLLEKLL